MSWQGKNCSHCWKYQSRVTDRTKARCKIAFDIDVGYISGTLPNRVDKITEMAKCPYAQEKRPAYARHTKDDENNYTLFI
jgi:hypothetical protein